MTPIAASEIVREPMRMIGAVGMAATLIASLVACAWLQVPSPSFLITAISAGASADDKSVIGIVCSIRNTGEIDFRSFGGEFYLYGTSAEPFPSSGRNRVVFDFSAQLRPGESRSFYIPLDTLLNAIPPQFTVDRFCITSVELNNGNVWRDPLRRYALSAIALQPEPVGQ